MAAPSIGGIAVPTTMSGRGQYLFRQPVLGRDGQGRAIGSSQYQVAWTFAQMTPAEMDFWTDTVLAGAISADTYFELLNDKNVGVYFPNGTLTRPTYQVWQSGLYREVTVGIRHLITGVVWAGILWDPAGDDILDEGSRCFLTNKGTRSVVMTGWKIHDLIGLRYTFPAFTLSAGASVTVYTKTGVDTSDTLYMNRGVAIWNNSGGDTGYLYNENDALISQFSYPG